MHNSQTGGPMAKTLTSSPWGWADDTTPNPSLLIYSCVGCHARVGSFTTIDNDAPIIFNTQSPTNPLAGGNFYYVVNDGDDKGHNVMGIKVADTNFSGKNIPGSATPYAGNQVTCAGTKGCHGNRGTSDQLDAMKGAHHTDDAAPLTGGTSVGKSYRFLKGILGKEDTNWEQDNINTSHNEYKGGYSFPATETISSLCGQCHGDFHSSLGVGSTSPWLRHPTDKVLNISGEYASYTTYSMTAPVARPDPDDASLVTTEVTPGTDIIMCLSCHRAHGSPNYKMIRWDYKANMSGCVVCHRSKD